MIRNVVLHLHGEQPMKADIEALPTAADAGLLCTNLRTLEGRKPISTEFLDSVFLIPYNVIRFIEIPRVSIGSSASQTDMPISPRQLPADAGPAGTSAPGTEAPQLAQDTILITPPPAASAAPIETEPDEGLEHLEPDEDLLRRIREA